MFWSTWNASHCPIIGNHNSQQEETADCWAQFPERSDPNDQCDLKWSIPTLIKMFSLLTLTHRITDPEWFCFRSRITQRGIMEAKRMSRRRLLRRVPVEKPERSSESPFALEQGDILILTLWPQGGTAHNPTSLTVRVCRMSDLSYQVEESIFSQKFYNASLMNCLKESIQWVSCVVFVTTFL